MKISRFISVFLIVFGLVGYCASIPLTMFSNSAIAALPPALDDVANSINIMKDVVVEAHGALTDFNQSIGDMASTISSFDLSSVDETIKVTIANAVAMLNDTQESLAFVNRMLNETETTVEAVETMLNETIVTLTLVEDMLVENADMLELFANNPQLQLIAPEVTSSASAVATSMRSSATALNNLPLDDAVLALQGLPITSVKNALQTLPLDLVTEGLVAMQESLQPMIFQFETAITELSTMLHLVQTYLTTITSRITDTQTTLHSWMITINDIRSRIGLVQIGVYGVIGYILCIHTAFLLIGIVIHRTLRAS